MRRSKTSQLTICALLISMALVLSYMERFIPLQMLIPLPGIKLGLANIVTVMALYFFGEKHAFTILILRCVLGSVFGGGISGLAFSLTGGLFAMTTMSIVLRLRSQCAGSSRSQYRTNFRSNVFDELGVRGRIFAIFIRGVCFYRYGDRWGMCRSI